MKAVLDFENNQKGKGSWKVVWITNSILIALSFISCYYVFFMAVNNISLPVEDKISGTIIMLCFWVITINSVCLFISLFFSKTYWKKWVMGVVVGVVLFIATLLIQFIIDFEKIMK